MPLKSNLFRNDKRLDACLIANSAHLTLGVRGEFVAKVQIALMDLDNLDISQTEISQKLYGPTTAEAVLAYKRKRNIINKSYQSTADNIVGKMTIASLDQEMFDKQEILIPGQQVTCFRHTPVTPVDQGAKTVLALAQSLVAGRFRVS